MITHKENAEITEIRKSLFFITFPQFLKEKMEEGSLIINPRGHWKNGLYLQESSYLLDRMFDFIIRELSTTQEQIFHFWMDQGLDKLDEFIPYKNPSYSVECYHCGEKLGLEIDGKTIRPTTECKYPDGVPPFTLQLSVPSGKIIFANDIREYFKVDKEKEHIDINTEIGLKRYSKGYEPTGLIICFCGNTCPKIYRQKDQSLAIGNMGINWDTDEEKEHPGERVGGIVTDLWWWCATDYNDLMNRIGDEKDNPHIMRHFAIVDVEPGDYEITQYHHTLEDSHALEPLTYATIKRIH